MNSSESAGLLALLIPFLIVIPIMVFAIVSMWKVFTKAGQPGWAVLIPIYNVYILMKMAGKPGWWLVLMLIPAVNIVIAIIAYIEIAKAFGKSPGFAALMILLPIVAFPILAFGDAKYTPPVPQA